MIFSTASTIALLSEFMTMEPGDVIATGTPSGVAHARKPPAWMKAGDKVEVEVEKIGVLANPIVDEAGVRPSGSDTTERWRRCQTRRV